MSQLLEAAPRAAPGVASTAAPAAAPRRAVDWWAIVGGLVGIATAMWLTRHAWGPRMMAGGDVSAHLVRADFGISQLIARHRLDGWFPRFLLGHQEFMFNGPGLTWAMAAVRLATFGALSNAGAIKVVTIGALALQPLSVAYLARALGCDRPAAAMAGVLSFTATVGYGLGLEGTFSNGLVSHQVGAVLFFASFGALLNVYDRPTRRTVTIAALALAALVVTHLISVMVLAVMFPIAFVFRLNASDRARALRGSIALAIAGAITFALAAFWLLPFLAHRDLHGPVVTWGTDPLDVRVAAILRGHLMFTTGEVKLIAIAWAVVVVRMLLGRRDHGVLLAVPVGFLVLAHVSVLYPGPGDVTLQLANRGLGYAGVLALLPVAVVLSLLVKTLARWTGHERAGVVIAALAVVLVVFGTLSHAKTNFVTQPSPPTSEFVEAAATLRSYVPDGGRFSMTRDYPEEITRAGVMEPARYMAWLSGLDTLNSFNPESSQAGGAAFTADGPGENQHIDDWVRALRRLGVNAIVVAKPAVEAQISTSPLARRVWSGGPFSIYQVLTDAHQPTPVLIDPGSIDADISFARRGPEHLSWHIDAHEDVPWTIAVGWSPKWHAKIDGTHAKITKTGDGVMSITVPAGSHALKLDYEADAADHVGVGMTLLAIIGLIAIPTRRKKKVAVS